MPKTIPCRPLWWRIPAAMIWAAMFLIGVFVFFGLGSLLLIIGGGK